MIRKYKYGFEYKGIIFGWHKKELFRISKHIKGRSYSKKKLTQIMIGNNVGYRICGDRKTIDQLSDLTYIINEERSQLINDELPF